MELELCVNGTSRPLTLLLAPEQTTTLIELINLTVDTIDMTCLEAPVGEFVQLCQKHVATDFCLTPELALMLECREHGGQFVRGASMRQALSTLMRSPTCNHFIRPSTLAVDLFLGWPFNQEMTVEQLLCGTGDLFTTDPSKLLFEMADGTVMERPIPTGTTTGKICSVWTARYPDHPYAKADIVFPSAWSRANHLTEKKWLHDRLLAKNPCQVRGRNTIVLKLDCLSIENYLAVDNQTLVERLPASSFEMSPFFEDHYWLQLFDVTTPKLVAQHYNQSANLGDLIHLLVPQQDNENEEPGNPNGKKRPRAKGDWIISTDTQNRVEIDLT